ncbi:MAG: RNA 3'-terminal phosphate cyclase [Candidatus Micrarchaeia archaeon]
MLEIDGAEGGGQILRTALSLSAVLGQPVRLTNIRKPRPNPGLQPQHLTCVNALTKICRAKISGAELGSPTLSFEPGQVDGGEYFFDIGTAGSTSLVVQAVLPALLFAKKPSRVVVRGGTHVAWSPDFHFLQKVFAPAAALFGARFSLTLRAYGFYPKGGGEVELLVEPCGGLRGVHLSERGRCSEVEGISVCANLPAHIATRQAQAVLGIFPNAKLKTETAKALSPGSFVSLWCVCEGGFLGASALGRPGKSAEEVGREAAESMRALLASPACVDNHLGDQLMIYAALAKGSSVLRVAEFTAHERSNAVAIEAFTKKPFVFDGANGTISVEGIGFVR